jgi:hypothetical protein
MLLDRLDAVGRSLRDTGQGLALIGLGSVGLERERLDRYSDLDFFAIVQPGTKARFVAQLDWLAAAHPIACAFRNTPDGCKVLMTDGVFCEFAVFEPDELPGIPFAPGRIVWKRDDVDAAIALPRRAAPPAAPFDGAWLLGEALTNLHVGLCRFRRGEKLSAARFVQGHAVDRVLDLATRLEPETAALRDAFSMDRRFEQRFPRTGALLAQFVQGYERTPASALAILRFLQQHFDVPPAMAQAIEQLIA